MKRIVRQKGNSKVKNATRVELDGIKFRSKLEAYTYRRLKEENLNFEYEKTTYTIIEKFEYMGEKMRAATLTPDFIDLDNKIMIEVKGFETDISKIKRKLLKYKLHLAREDWKIYMVNSQKKVEETIQLIKNVQGTHKCD